MSRLAVLLLVLTGITALALGGLFYAPSFTLRQGEVAEPVPPETTFLNLDFEVSPTGTLPKGWFCGGQGYEVRLDSEVAHSGDHSLRIHHLGQTLPGQSFGIATGTFPVADAVGHKIRFSGWIRTETVAEGWAGLWWRIDGPGGAQLGFDNMAGRGPRGTTPWASYAIELAVPEGAVNINFGALMPGTGTAWFDGLQVELDGEPYPQVQPIPFEPSEAQLAWLRETAVPLTTDDPGADLGDLEPLKEIVGDARVVALGEGTHGTREFFRMKHRLVRFLAEKMGFTVFAIEASLPEARRVDDYVRTDEGDPRKALAGMYFWTWNTEEVLELIEWMRRSNQHGRRIEFWGFDLQFPDVAMDNVEGFVARADPEALDDVRDAYGEVREAVEAIREQQRQAGRGGVGPMPTGHHERWRLGAQKVLERLESQRDTYLAREGVSAEETAWALRNARVVVQGVEAQMPGKATRDASMAENVEWILEQHPPGTKIVLWAHNGHISELGGSSYTPMGHHLAERYGEDLVSVGFAFHEGRYTAVGRNGLAAYGTSPSRPGTFEWALHRSGMPRLLLDLRRASETPESSEASGWLHDELEMRSIGAMAMDDAFYPFDLTGAFDLLIYLDHTEPSKPLGAPASP